MRLCSHRAKINRETGDLETVTRGTFSYSNGIILITLARQVETRNKHPACVCIIDTDRTSDLGHRLITSPCVVFNSVDGIMIWAVCSGQ